MIDWNNVKHVSEGMATKGQSPSSINWDKVEYIPNKIAAKNTQIKSAQTANFEERFAPKLDTKAIDMFATPKPKPESKSLLQMSQGAQQAMFNAPVMTPIDQRINLFPNNEKADNRKYIGSNLIQAYEEDSPLKKVGKGIVNYGVGGALSLLGNVGGAPQQAMMQTSRAGTNAILGKPQDFREMSFGKDLLGTKEDNLLTMAASAALDPATYIGGGIVDDLSRAGFMGKASRPSTEMVQVLGDSQQKLLAKQAAKEAKQAGTVVDDIPAIGNKADDVQTQINKMDDYFQQKRTDPLGSKLPKAEPKPIGGELPKGDIPEGMKERGFSRNVRTDTTMPDDIRISFDEDPLIYKQISNDDTLKKAQTIFEQGDEVATAELYRSLGSKEFKPESVPLSKLIAKQAMESGNVEKARQVLSETAEKLTEAGQFSQAAKILRESDPETFLMTIDKQIVKLNEQGLKQYGKKWTNVDLLPDEITAIQNIPRGNQQAYEEVWEQIGNRIAKSGLPSTGMEKFDAWRRMAMLLNPKTHIRNVGGNVIMMGMRKSGDTVGAAFEKVFGVKTGNRTKSFGWSLNKKVASKVDETWDIVKKDILGESRWEIDNLKSLGREKRIFNKGLPTKAVEAVTGHKFDRGALQWANEFSLKTLNAEDNIFTQRAFKDALGQFMQANKLDVATDTAIAYAKRRALEATFKQANELASTLNRWKQKPVVGKFVEGAVPFTKTPANIAMRGIEYSPGGLFKALYDVRAGKTAATVIEDLSKGLTGTAITSLGFWLASMGWAKVERNRSSKAEALMQEMGDQANSIITPLGSYTFDWGQPFAIPLAMGIAAQEAIRSRKDGSSLIMAIKDGIAAGGDTIFNMTMLRNIREIIGSYGSPTEKIMGIPVDYLEQAIFSALGQTARTIDPVKRSTYDPDPTKQWWNTIKARIPGLSQSLEPSLGIWGQEQKQGNWVQQFINPGYFKERNNDPVTNEVARLYSGNKDNDMLPKVAPKSFSADKIEFRLTPKQLTEFQRRMGQDNHKEIGQLINSSEYRSMTDEQRIKKIKKIVNDNYEDIKKDIAKSK